MNRASGCGFDGAEDSKSEEPAEQQPDQESGMAASDSVDCVTQSLLEQLEPQMRRLAWAIVRDWDLASDAVQDTFSRFAEKFDEIAPEHRAGWLVRSVQLVSQNLRRKHQRLETGRSDFLGQQVSVGSAHTTQIDVRDQADYLRECMRSLPETQRVVLRMRLVEGRRFAEIAEKLDLPLGTVLSRMRLAIEKLRSGWTDEEQ